MRHRSFEAGVNHAAQPRLLLENTLRLAIDQEEFQPRLYRRPQIRRGSLYQNLRVF